MSEIPRVSVQEVRQKMQSGATLLLVSAYPNEDKFQSMHLEGAISLPEFERRLPSLSQGAEIVFY